MGVGASAGAQATQVLSELKPNERRKLLELSVKAESKAGILGAIEESSDAVKDAFSKMSEEERIIAFVVDVLQDQGWCKCDPSQIQIQDKSGEGGSKTWKVTALGMHPESVAFHDRSMFADESLSEQIMHAAGRHFEAHGLGPRRLGEGRDWFIEVWEGERVKEFHLEKHFADYGHFLGRLHRAPATWYDSWRQKLREAYPRMHDVADCSHMWYYASAAEKILECCRADVLDDYFRPVCPVAQRLVGTHGELCTVNFLETNEGFKAIDFETECVTVAAFDLATAMLGISDEWFWEGCSSGLVADDDEKPKLKRALLESYLKSVGEPAGIEEVDNLLIDVELYFLAHSCSPVGPMACFAREDQFNRLYGEKAHRDAALAWWKDYVKRVRGGDAVAREELLTYGITLARDRFVLEQLDILSIQRKARR